MRRRRVNRRGLAEIVGTLMLVLIVVAAAVAFSLFVASYQTQLQNEEKANHDRSLEMVHFLNISVGAGGLTVNLTFVSADVNYMNITGYELSGFAVQAWMFYPQGGGPTPAWMNTTGCSNATSVTTSVKNEACDMVAPFQTVSAVLIPAKAVASPIQLGIFTSRANEFLFNFIAPVAIASVYFVQTGAGNTTPVFDGSTSYQPSEADNATIVSYDWRITLKSSGALAANGSGAELEVGSLPPATYTVKLTVYNSDGLNGTTSIPYYQS